MPGVLYIAIFTALTCFLISYFLAPIVKYIGESFNIVDFPNHRKVHTKPIVRIGGLSILISFFLCLLITKELPNFNSLFAEYSDNLNIILLGAFCFFLVGFHDDIFKSPPLFRLILQFAIAFFVSYKGLTFPDLNFYLPYFGEINMMLSPFVGCLFAAIWIVSITNSINWLDGIDGLSSGFCLILTLGLLSIMNLNGNILGILFYSCLGGSIVGFLIRNFKPAYYIMGDCGSNFLGFTLSTSSLTFLKHPTLNTIPIYYLILIFSLPVFDMCFVILNRLLNRKSIFQADRGHIHHRLLDLNFKYEELIFVLYFYSFISVSLGIANLNKYLN